VERLPDVEGKNVSFAVLKRTGPLRVIYTAFTAKGNSTFGIAMSSDLLFKHHADAMVPEFNKVLRSVSLSETIWPR
jgi:hypothetical protein